MFRLFITAVLLSLGTQSLFSQDKLTLIKKDSSFFEKNLLLIRPSLLITGKSFGFQTGIAKNIRLKEIHKQKKKGGKKIIRKATILSVDLGYYYQRGLHHNWFLTGSYTLRTIGRKGIYADFSPMLGISRTFITDETYKVENNGMVSLKKLAGNWYAATGFAIGGGKLFNSDKNYLLKDIYVKMFVQVLYPNFGFIALRPSFQIGTSIELKKHGYSSKKIIKHK
jgi:hypothetical protein